MAGDRTVGLQYGAGSRDHVVILRDLEVTRGTFAGSFGMARDRVGWVHGSPWCGNFACSSVYPLISVRVYINIYRARERDR